MCWNQNLGYGWTRINLEQWSLAATVVRRRMCWCDTWKLCQKCVFVSSVFINWENGKYTLQYKLHIKIKQCGLESYSSTNLVIQQISHVSSIGKEVFLARTTRSWAGTLLQGSSLSGFSLRHLYLCDADVNPASCLCQDEADEDAQGSWCCCESHSWFARRTLLQWSEALDSWTTTSCLLLGCCSSTSVRGLRVLFCMCLPI